MLDYETASKAFYAARERAQSYFTMAHNENRFRAPVWESDLIEAIFNAGRASAFADILAQDFDVQGNEDVQEARSWKRAGAMQETAAAVHSLHNIDFQG